MRSNWAFTERVADGSKHTFADRMRCHDAKIFSRVIHMLVTLNSSDVKSQPPGVVEGELGTLRVTAGVESVVGYLPLAASEALVFATERPTVCLAASDEAVGFSFPSRASLWRCQGSGLLADGQAVSGEFSGYPSTAHNTGPETITLEFHDGLCFRPVAAIPPGRVLQVPRSALTGGLRLARAPSDSPPTGAFPPGYAVTDTGMSHLGTLLTTHASDPVLVTGVAPGGAYVVRASGRVHVLDEGEMASEYTLPGGPFSEAVLLQGSLEVDGRRFPLPYSLATSPPPSVEQRSRKSQVGDMSLRDGGVVQAPQTSAVSAKMWLMRPDLPVVLDEAPVLPTGWTASRASAPAGSEAVRVSFGIGPPAVRVGAPGLPEYTAVLSGTSPLAMTVEGVFSAAVPAPGGTEVELFCHRGETGAVSFSWRQKSDAPSFLNSGTADGSLQISPPSAQVFRGFVEPETAHVSCIVGAEGVTLVSRPFPLVSEVRVFPESASCQFYTEAGGSVTVTLPGKGVRAFGGVVSLGRVVCDVPITLEVPVGGGYLLHSGLEAGDHAFNSVRTAAHDVSDPDAELSLGKDGVVTAKVYSGLSVAQVLTAPCRLGEMRPTGAFGSDLMLPYPDALTPVSELVCQSGRSGFGVTYNPYRFRTFETDGGTYGATLPWGGGEWKHATVRPNQSGSGAQTTPGKGFKGYVDDLSLFEADVSDGETFVVTGSRPPHEGGYSAAVERHTPLAVLTPSDSTVSFMVKATASGGSLASPFTAEPPHDGEWHMVSVVGGVTMYVDGVLSESLDAPVTQVEADFTGNLDTVQTFSGRLFGPVEVQELHSPPDVSVSGVLSWVKMQLVSDSLVSTGEGRAFVSLDQAAVSVFVSTSGLSGTGSVLRVGDVHLSAGISSRGADRFVVLFDATVASVYVNGSLVVDAMEHGGSDQLVILDAGVSGQILQVDKYQRILQLSEIRALSRKPTRYAQLAIHPGENSLRVAFPQTWVTDERVPGVLARVAEVADAGDSPY